MHATLNEEFIEGLIAFRKILHQHPELSGKEKNTPKIVLDFLNIKESNSVITKLGGNGMALIYKGKKEGPNTVIRCELDALPIAESNEFSYKSKKKDVSHKCGHDGHMTILAGLGKLLQHNQPEKGTVILLFQPAEETGEGAEKVLKDERFTNLKPDYMYALHNVPELKKNTVFIKEATFSAASRGMIVKLYGATSHAAEPENGKSPAQALASIINKLEALPQQHDFKDLTLVTVVHAKLGEIAFGVSPGYAEVRATLRTYLQEDMNTLVKKAEEIVKKASAKKGLKTEVSYTEVFPETFNDPEAVAIVQKSAEKSKIELKFLSQPFKWSEDFGHFSARYKSALFALGAGEETPKLHNHHYDFPDEIIKNGILMFNNILHFHNY